jgi:hypothetical protein
MRRKRSLGAPEDIIRKPTKYCLKRGIKTREAK